MEMKWKNNKNSSSTIHRMIAACFQNSLIQTNFGDKSERSRDGMEAKGIGKQNEHTLNVRNTC